MGRAGQGRAGQGRTRNDADSTFTSGGEDSKRRVGRGEPRRTARPGFRTTGLVAVGRKTGWMGGELRAGPRPPLQASSDSHRHPGHRWRSPGRWLAWSAGLCLPELGRHLVSALLWALEAAPGPDIVQR